MNEMLPSTPCSSPQDDAHRLTDEQRRLVVAKALMSIGFQPEETPQDIAIALSMWATALQDAPIEFVEQAAVQIARTATRRPTPGEVLIVARRLWNDSMPVEPVRPETREERKARQAREAAEAERRENINRAIAAQRIIRDVFGPDPSEIPAMWREDYVPTAHWTEGLPKEHPRMVELEKARAENPLIREAPAEAERMRQARDRAETYPGDRNPHHRMVGHPAPSKRA